MSTKIHVRNISSTVAEVDLQSTFGKFGIVDAVEIARDPDTQLSKGFAFVTMSRNEDALKAIGRLHFSQYEGRIIAVGLSQDSKL